jgi:hypothetical protein
MVPSPDGTGVVLIGGSYAMNLLYELKCSSTTCKWSLMEQQLQVRREHSVAMYVPSSFGVCEN